MKKLMLLFVCLFCISLSSCGNDTVKPSDVKTNIEQESEEKTETEKNKNDDYVIPEDNSDLWGFYETYNGYCYTIEAAAILNSNGYSMNYERLSRNIIKFDNRYFFIQENVLFEITSKYVYIKK